MTDYNHHVEWNGSWGLEGKSFQHFTVTCNYFCTYSTGYFTWWKIAPITNINVLLDWKCTYQGRGGNKYNTYFGHNVEKKLTHKVTFFLFSNCANKACFLSLMWSSRSNVSPVKHIYGIVILWIYVSILCTSYLECLHIRFEIQTRIIKSTISIKGKKWLRFYPSSSSNHVEQLCCLTQTVNP